MWLGLDGSNADASVALVGEGRTSAELAWTSERRPTEEFAPAVRELLARAGAAPGELAGLAVALGPGSYAGLRATLALAKGLALVLNRPLTGIPTLDLIALAHRHLAPPRASRLWAVLEVGRGRLVAAAYALRSDGPWPAIERLQPRSWPEVAREARTGDCWCGDVPTDALIGGRLVEQADAPAPSGAQLSRATVLAELSSRHFAAAGSAEQRNEPAAWRARMTAARSADELDAMVPIYPDPPR